MVDLSQVDSIQLCSRALIALLATFVFIYIVAKIIGKERKDRWFKRRRNYTLLNRRGVFGEYINFGYPRTWQGLIVAIVMYAVILGGGYLYIFVYPY